MLVEHPSRPLVQMHLASGDWHDVMEWASRQPVGTQFLADPGHAQRYGTSVRVESGRDVYLEIVKDTGMAIYSADVAHRVSERTDDLGHFNQLDAERALALAGQYELDYLITEQWMNLPETRQTGRFHVYDLAGDPRVVAATLAVSSSPTQDN